MKVTTVGLDLAKQVFSVHGVAQMGQDALDHRRIDDGGDDLQLATVRGLFEVGGEDALEQPRPTQARRSVASASSRGRTR